MNLKKTMRTLALACLLGLLFLSGCSSPFISMAPGAVSDRAVAATWTPGTYYAAGAVVSYNGSLYTCRQPHTALAGWEPPNVPALWQAGGNADPVAPATPAGLMASGASATSIAVSWSASEGANAYDIEADGTAVQVNATSWTHTGLVAGSSHQYRVRAKNAIGASPWSAVVTGVAQKPDTNPVNLPKHILTGYWQNFNNGAKVLRISEVPVAYNLICVSFADATSTPGAVSFTLDSSLGFSEAQFIADIASVKARGQHVIISVGGQNGTISVADAASAANFAASVNGLIAKYGFEGVDIDLENGVNSTWMAAALRQVKAGSIITMAPETIGMQSTGAEYFKLALAIKDILTVCNMQYYNSGSMLGYDGKVYSQGGEDFLTALAAIQLENGLRPDQVGLGLPASTRGAGSGYVSPQVVVNALDTLATGAKHGSYQPPHTYPAIRGAMTWSINWDASNNWDFSNVVGAKLAAMNAADGGGDTQAPSAPGAVAVSAITANSVHLSWGAASDNVGVAGYTVTWGSGSLTVAGTAADITGLAAATAYTFAVTARDAAGNTGAAASASATTAQGGDTAAPTAPGNPAASGIAKDSAQVSWTASTDNVGVTGYTVSWTGGNQTVTGTSASLSGLAAATTYSVSVKALDAAGNQSPAATVSFTTLADGNSADVWTPGVYYKLGDVVTYGGSTWTCRNAHTALAGWEPPNVPALWLAGGTIQDPGTTVPAVPGGVSAVALGSSSISVSWTAVAGATGYDVQADGATVSDANNPWTHSGLGASTNHSYKVRAKNAKGTSDWSALASASTSPLNNGSTKRIMSGYWHSWGGGASGGVPFVKLRDVNPAWDVVNVSFAEPVSPGSGDGQMKFVVSGLDASYTVADFKADIRNLQAAGRKVVLSIGGYEGYFSLNSAAAVGTFVNAIKGFVNEYGFDGIDIDLEQSSIALNSGADPDFKNPTSPKVVNMISAIRQICDAYGTGFILSWAPETFYLQLGHQYYAGINQYVDARAGCYIPLIHALRDKTSWVQAQLYNSGVIVGNDGVAYNMGTVEGITAMCEMLLSGFTVNGNASYVFPALRPDQVVIAVPASASAAGSGQISNAGLQQAFRNLEARHPGLRGIMAWSINWDAYQNGNSFVTANKAFLNSLN